MVLLWGVPRDSPMARVRAALARRGVEIAFVDERDVVGATLELELRSPVLGVLHSRESHVDLEKVTAAYLRPYGATDLAGVSDAGPASPEWHQAVAFERYLWMWAEHTPARVVNRPSAMASNDSKPYQAEVAQRSGFRVPETLITTDPDLAREFLIRHRAIVYKSISSVRSIVSRLAPDELLRLEDVRWCPTQFQEYIPGIDFRVHVVGNELFSVAIESDADDYRYAHQAGKHCQMTSTYVPECVADACRRVTRELGLLFSGIDLRRTAAGEWYCFEVNTSPGFSYFDTEAGEIARAVADLLADAA